MKKTLDSNEIWEPILGDNWNTVVYFSYIPIYLFILQPLKKIYMQLWHICLKIFEERC